MERNQTLYTRRWRHRHKLNAKKVNLRSNAKNYIFHYANEKDIRQIHKWLKKAIKQLQQI